ncbi:hypothetical protein Leryth_023834 [Lithospermum erythrorhizon]|nr:hypothetical protein Leryth_023834 [Lithospermum erythrorhizon]
MCENTTVLGERKNYIINQVENQEGAANFDEILANSDAFMVAREFAVRTMAKICLEAESTIDYPDVFKRIMNNAPVPMSPLESLASSAVRTANSARAALILVLTRGGSTAKLVAKYVIPYPTPTRL